MKKQLLGKVFTALVLIAVTSYFIDLQAQVSAIFENSDDRAARTEGIAGRDALHLNYTIDGSGNVAVDAVTPATDEAVIAFVDTWDNPNAGTTDVTSLFGKTFSLVLSTNGSRLDCREKGGLGIQGQNSGRIDGGGSEELYITLEGSVGLKFDSLMYEPTERGGGDNAHFVLRDHDTDELFYTPEGHFIYTPTDTTFVRDSVIAFDPGLLELRFASERLTVKESDTLAGGGRLLGLFFTLMDPTNPSIAGISPTPGDTLVDVNTDFVILFNMTMNTATTEGAVVFTPELTNRVNTWNGAGDELTISSDGLAYLTDYELAIGTGIAAAGGANALISFNYLYQSLPDNPTIIATYPADEATNVPAGTPMTLTFSISMNTDSVQNALSFDPPLSELSFAWNGSSTKVVISAADMAASTEYKVTLGTDATDSYGVSFAESAEFSFTTAAPVSTGNTKLRELMLYPNPASDVLYIRGVDVSSATVHSLSGQLIKTVYDTNHIDLSDVKSGSYIVTVADDVQNSVRKLIVVQ